MSDRASAAGGLVRRRPMWAVVGVTVVILAGLAVMVVERGSHGDADGHVQLPDRRVLDLIFIDGSSLSLAVPLTMPVAEDDIYTGGHLVIRDGADRRVGGILSVTRREGSALSGDAGWSGDELSVSAGVWHVTFALDPKDAHYLDEKERRAAANALRLEIDDSGLPMIDASPPIDLWGAGHHPSPPTLGVTPALNLSLGCADSVGSRPRLVADDVYSWCAEDSITVEMMTGGTLESPDDIDVRNVCVKEE